jgi:hypothetical protein
MLCVFAERALCGIVIGIQGQVEFESWEKLAGVRLILMCNYE